MIVVLTRGMEVCARHGGYPAALIRHVPSCIGQALSLHGVEGRHVVHRHSPVVRAHLKLLPVMQARLEELPRKFS